MNPSPVEPRPFASQIAIDPAELLSALSRQKWLVLLSTVVVGAAVTAGTMRQAKIYAAVARVRLDPDLPQVLPDGAESDPYRRGRQAETSFKNTQLKTMTCRAVIADVVQREGLMSDLDFLSTRNLSPASGVREVEKALLASVEVLPEDNSRIVQIVVEDYDPKRAARLATAVGQAFIDYALDRRLENTLNASRWLNKQVVEFKNRLEARERALHEFRERNTLVSVSIQDRQNMTAASLGILNEKLLEIRARLIERRSRKANVDAQLEAGTEAADIAQQVEASSTVATLRSSLEVLQRKRSENSVRYGPKHPVMVGLERKVLETKEALDHEVEMVLLGLDSEIETLIDTELHLATAMEEEKSKALALNSMGLEYAKLNRDLDTTKETYQNLVKRQTETELAGRLKSKYVDWFEKAEPVLVPVRPSLPKNAALGFGLGLLLGVAVVVLRVLLDNTVHSRTDIEEWLRLPFLGVFPRILNPDGSMPPDRDLWILKHPKSGAAECARSVRTNLVFMSTDRPLRRLLLTSARPGEGKTTTITALGIAMAQAGNKVIMLDTDLRKPRLHRAFGVSGEKGLTSVLVGESLESCIKSTELVNLSVLPCGPIAPNPAELLHSEKFLRLLDELGEKYDRVLLDSPPIGVVTDATILSKVADGTILVVQANSTPKEAIRRSARQLFDVGATVLGAVLNDFEIGRKGSRGYYDYYDYQYYRGYGENEGEAAS